MRKARVVKPLTGFGPIGWISVIILAALSAGALAGVDFLWLYLRTIAALVGTDGLIAYLRLHVFHGLAIRAPGFSLLSLLYVFPALFIFPKRVGWWRYAILIVWALIHPLPQWHQNITHPFAFWLKDVLYLSQAPLELSHGILELTTCVLLLLVTRSWLVFAASTAATIVLYGLLAATSPNPATSPPGYERLVLLMAGLWHVMVAAGLLAWGIRARLRSRRVDECQSCGYSLVGSVSQRCPECGLPPADAQGSRGSQPALSSGQRQIRPFPSE